MAERLIRVLLVDDDEDDFVLTRDLLTEIAGNSHVLEWVAEFDEALDSICRGTHDVCLIDLRLGARSGVDLLREVRLRGCKGPFIILTGVGQRELDLEAMQAGAADYLEKGQLTAALLERSIRYAIQQEQQASELERRVRDRTAELAQANRRLKEVIRERERSEEAIRRRSEQLQELARIASHLNVAQDITEVMKLITDAARTIIGAHQAVTSQVDGQNWERAIHTVSLSEKYAAWRGSEFRMNGGGIYNTVVQEHSPIRLTQAQLEAHPQCKADATRKPPLCGLLAAPLVGREGKALGLIQLSDRHDGDFTGDDEAILVQLAQMTSAALENARMYQDLREQDRRKDEFLAMLAHELRNPLAPLRNALYLFRMETEQSDEMVCETLGMMDRQVEHLVRLVDDLLDVGRITRGKIILQKEPVDLLDIVSRAVETSKTLIGARAHRLEVTVPEGPLPIEGDSVRLAQVLLNLLNNAAKFTPDGGQIRLTVERAGQEAVVRVRDSGMGISAEMLPHVFELFTQGDRTIERAEGGLGIGLTLVKSLTEMHGGTVKASSEGPGKGSEFTIRLPLLTSPVTRRSPAKEMPLTPGPGRRILIVDDNRDAARSLGTLLRLLGNETRIALGGWQALEEVPEYLPDVVVLDIGMPGLNGLEVARRIRALPLHQPLLVALTGFGSEEDRRQAQKAGFDAHLVKPVDLEALKAVLTRQVVST